MDPLHPKAFPLILIECDRMKLSNVVFFLQIVAQPVLRNEVYCQVMKQLSGNPKQESLISGWMLMALLSEFVCPQENFLQYVLHFVQGVKVLDVKITFSCSVL